MLGAACGGVPIVLLKAPPLHNPIDFGLWRSREGEFRETWTDAVRSNGITWLDEFNEILSHGVWLVNSTSDPPGTPPCLLTNPSTWEGHGRRKIEAAQVAGSLVFGARPATVACSPSSEGWPLNPTNSHKCHLSFCYSPMDLCNEPAYANCKRNYCEGPSVAGGPCSCGASPPCKRRYRAAYPYKDLVFLRDWATVKGWLQRMFGPQHTSWRLMTAEEVVAEYNLRQGQRIRRRRQVISDAAKQIDRSQQRAAASAISKKKAQDRNA